MSDGMRITVFPMKTKHDGNETLAEADMGDKVEFWNIVVRDQMGNWIDGEEDLTHPKEIDEHVQYFQTKYPDATLEYEG